MKTSFGLYRYEQIEGQRLIAETTVNPKLIITIPVYAEPDLCKTIASLIANNRCTAGVECIVLINEPEEISDEIKVQNHHSFKELDRFCSTQQCDWIILHCIYVVDIPKKKAGVGLARKLAMSEAAQRLIECGNAEDGLIVALDADCTVSKNYLQSLIAAGAAKTKKDLFNIHFEHNLSHAIDLDAIVRYELHLRYFIKWQRILKLPYAYQTIGSSFAVRPKAYLQVGGMNIRKAGEDFYFIHKFSKKGTITDHNSCIVYPSSRRSERVPFGTGRAIGQCIDTNTAILTYNVQSFVELVPFIKLLPYFWSGKIHSNEFDRLSNIVIDFLREQNFQTTIRKLKANTKSFETFEKSFFQWFDAFRLMKYLHYARSCGNSDQSLEEALVKSITVFEIGEAGWTNMKWLHALRMDHSSSVNTFIS